MVTVKKQRTAAINITFDGDFNGGTCMSESYVNLLPAVPPDYPEIVYLYVRYKSFTEALNYQFRLDVEITIPFMIEPIKEITPLDFYKCVESTKEHLDGIINSIFSGHVTPIVPPILFDDISGTIYELLADLKK